MAIPFEGVAGNTRGASGGVASASLYAWSKNAPPVSPDVVGRGLVRADIARDEAGGG